MPQANPITINDGDGVIFMNYRADRHVKVLTHLMTLILITFNVKKIGTFCYVALTQYDKSSLSLLRFLQKKSPIR